MFRKAAGELATTYIDMSQKVNVVNMTYWQTMAGKFLQKFLDPDTVAKMFISSKADDPEVLKDIDPS